MCFLWASEDVRQQNPYAGLLVLNKQKHRGPSSTFAFKEVNHLWGVINPDGLELCI